MKQTPRDFINLHSSEKVIMKAMFLLLALLTSQVFAQTHTHMQYTNLNGEVFEVWKKPCHQANQVGFQYAEWRSGHESIKGCWVMWGGTVVIYFDDGDGAKIRIQDFQVPQGS